MAKDVDNTDDWMNPSMSGGTLSYTPPTGVKWSIMRKKCLITFGDPVYEWREWSEFDTKEEMRAALAKLRAEHPAWVLKGAERNYDLERIGIYPSHDEIDMTEVYDLIQRRA